MAWQDVLPLVLRSAKGVPLDATDMDLNFTLIGQMLCDLVAGHDHDGVNSKAIPIEVTIDNFPDATIIGGKLQSSDWGAAAGTQIDLLNKTMMFGGSAAPKFSVNAAGVLTARDALLSGAITASTIDIGGTDATSLHVDVNGNLWSGAATFASAPFRVSYAGAMRALNGEFTGTITASTFRTAASGARIEINVAGGIQAWNADPVQTVDINVDGSGWFGLTSARAIQWTAAGVVKVGGFTATATTLSDTASGKTVLMSIGATAFAAGTTGAPEFYVTSAGALVATNATIGGAIVGATIDIGGADATSFHVDGSGNLWSGAAAYADAPFRVSDAGELTALSATISGNITATGGTIGGFTIDPTEGLYVGSAGTRIQLKAGTGIWLGATAFASAPFSVSPAGSLIAQSGTVGGFTIDAIHGLYAGSGVTRVQMKPGAGIWAGATAIGDAPFSVTPAGALVAANANVAGTITATAGTIGGFTVNATDGLYAGSGATRVQMKPGAGIWAGATAIGDAPFSVTQAGVLKAVSGTIGGNVLATTHIQSGSFLSGPLGYGWRISSTGEAEFQNVSIRGKFTAAVFEMDTVSAVNGMLMVSRGDTLAADMTAADSSTLVITGATTFSVGEVLRIKDGTDDEWLLVTDATYAPTYTVTRDLAGAYGANANPAWKSGAAVVSMGVGSGTKTGYIVLDASSGNSPFIDVYGRNSTTYTDVTLHGRFGWLKGITDADVGLSGTDVWGLYTDAAYIKGVIVANTGRIGGSSGWVISSKSIKDASGLVGLSADVTAGDDIRFWAGHATPASAPFSVTEAGVLKASSGTVGGFTLSATALYAGSAATRIQLDTTAGLWLGATAFASAPFRVSLAGALTAQGATIQSAASGARIVLNSTGLAIYDASAQRAAILATGAGWLGSATTFAWTTAGVVTAGGWTINSVALFKDSGSDATSSGLAPADYPFYAGKQYSGRATAPFRVTPAGALVATNASISGAISAATIDIGGSDATSFHVDINGNFWSGASSYASAPFKVSSAGALTAASATIAGDIKTSSTVGTTKGVHLSATNNELYFYGDPTGAGTSIEKLASIGVNELSGDYYVAVFGSGTQAAPTSTRIAALALSLDSPAIVTSSLITTVPSYEGAAESGNIFQTKFLFGASPNGMPAYTYLRGFYNYLSGGTIAHVSDLENVEGFRTHIRIDHSAATSVFGLSVYSELLDCTIGTFYELYLTGPGDTSTITNRYGIYQLDSASKNFLFGKTSIGDSVTSGLATRAFNLIATDACFRMIRVHDSYGPSMEWISRSTGGSTVHHWDMYTDPATGRYSIRDRTSSDLDRLSISSSGYVGIGTTAPGAQLMVISASGSGVAQFMIGDNGASNTYFSFKRNTSNGVLDITGYQGEYGVAIVNGGLYVGATGNAGADNVYVVGNCSALSFTDRTPAFGEDAISAIKKIKNKDGKIDHESLPAFARKTITIRDKDGKEVIEDGRDLGAMISIHTAALQQLLDRIERLESSVNKEAK